MCIKDAYSAIENARAIVRRSAGAIGGSNQAIEAARSALAAAAAEQAAEEES